MDRFQINIRKTFKINVDTVHVLLNYMMEVESHKYGCHVTSFAIFHLVTQLFPKIEFDAWIQNMFHIGKGENDG